MANLSFGEQVEAWANKTEAQITDVLHLSVQALENEVKTPVSLGGNMPVDTGNLRRSLIASTTAMPTMKPGQEVFPDVTAANMTTVFSAKLGQTIYLGFQAIYARRQNYGFVGTDSLGRTYNQAGRQFVGLAAQRWNAIVAEQVVKVRDGAAGQ